MRHDAISGPSPETIAPGSPSGAIAAKRPFGPSSIRVAAVNPVAASSAAMTPSCAAFAGCSCFDMAPSERNSHRPAVIVPADPSAISVACESSCCRRLAAEAAPSVPAVPVMCQCS